MWVVMGTNGVLLTDAVAQKMIECGVKGVAEMDVGAIRVWERGELVVDEKIAPQEPEFVRCGAYGETCEFIAALQEQLPLLILGQYIPLDTTHHIHLT